LGSDESVGGLLQLGLGIEVAQVLERVDGNILGDSGFTSCDGFVQPWVLESFFSGWSLVLIKSKKFRDEIFALIRNSFPGWVVEVELS